jgi:hypothetical protein
VEKIEIKTVLLIALGYLMCLVASMCSRDAEAKEWHLIEPREVYLDAYDNGEVHDPYLYPDDATLGYGANFIMNFDVLKYGPYGLHWDNRLHFDQSRENGQVRHAGWEYGLYLTLLARDDETPIIEAFHQHHSRHILDREREFHFPVYDRFGVRFVLYERQPQRKSEPESPRRDSRK